MPMAVWSLWHQLVHVVVVTVVVRMGVLMRHGLMDMRVPVKLDQVKHDASEH